MRRFVLVVAWVALAPLWLAPSALRAEDEPARQPAREDIFPLAAVRPGLKGYGLTVRSGTRIERFEVEVIDVVRHYMVKQDLILVRCLGDDFADHQIARGMSGSPIYFEGRCAGALAYTWTWAKHPVGGVTPIEAMLAEGERPLEGRATGRDPATPLARPRPGEAGATEPAGTLQPIGHALALGGFSEEGRRRLGQHFAAQGLFACPGPGAGAPGGAGDWADLEAPMEPGSTLMIDLARGDFTAAIAGTCTFVDGDKVYGYGHPFDSLGETELPLSVGYVYLVVASREISFKLSGSIRSFGTLIQDRETCIVGVRGASPAMVPIRARFRNAKTGREESFAFELTPNRIYFQPLAVAGLRECFTRAEATLGPNTKRVSMTVKIRGLEPWTFDDAVGGFDGGFQRTLIHLLDRPLNHLTQRVEFESFDLDVEVEHVDRRALVRAVTASKDEVRPGESLALSAFLELKEGGTPVQEHFDVRIPEDAPEGNYVITLVGGDYVPTDIATPVDIAQIPLEYPLQLKSTDLVAVLPTARVDVDWDGHLLRNLPLSSLPRIARSPGGTSLRLRPKTERVIKPVAYVVDGRAIVTVRVVR